MQWLTKDDWFYTKVKDSQSPNTLSFLVLHLFVPHQGSALEPLGELQRSADPLLTSLCFRGEKRPSAFYKLILEHKHSGMTKCLEKPLTMGPFIKYVSKIFQKTFLTPWHGDVPLLLQKASSQMFDWVLNKPPL